MATTRSQAKIRHEVERLREEHGVTEVPIPVEDIARTLGADLRYLPYDGDLSGMIFRDESRTVIGVNSLHHPNRQRFTIAHEIGHMLLHKGQEIFIDRIYWVNRRDDVSAQAVEPEEIEANRFASELLMPHALLEADLRDLQIDIEDEEAMKKLANKYGVSLLAMTFRVNYLMKVG